MRNEFKYNTGVIMEMIGFKECCYRNNKMFDVALGTFCT